MRYNLLKNLSLLWLNNNPKYSIHSSYGSKTCTSIVLDKVPQQSKARNLDILKWKTGLGWDCLMWSEKALGWGLYSYVCTSYCMYIQTWYLHSRYAGLPCWRTEEVFSRHLLLVAYRRLQRMFQVTIGVSCTEYGYSCSEGRKKE